MKTKISVVILLCTLLSSCVHTEVEVNGNIAGSVREKGSAKAISGCSISIEPGNNQNYSSDDGSYSFTGLQMGDYTLTASKSGYVVLTEAITIAAGKTLNHDIMLTPAKAPMVSTDSVTNLLANSATLCGTIIDKGGAAILKRGFYYGNDSTKMSIVYSADSSDSISSFTNNIVDLKDGITYYYQSFAINEIGEGKGDLKSFSTKELFAPSVKTSSPTAIGTTTVTLHGEITDNGNCPIMQCGFYVGLTPNLDQKYTYSSNSESILNMAITNLKSNMTYYYCIFAENQKGESKGDVLSFTTLETSKPIVYTNHATDVTAKSAILHATLSDNGGCEITEYGFYIGTAASSLIKQKIGNIQDNLYSYSYGNLSDGTTYYFQAYAINEKGESKGEILSFKTTQLALPELQTKEVLDVSYISAKFSAVITSNGSSNIKEYGFYYGIYANPTNKINVGSGNVQNYSNSVNSLSPNTTYYVKAYAVNDKGEGYGDVISFQTPAYSIPQVQTGQATSVTDRSATCTGTIISNGGQNIIEQGICYSKSANPTINGSHATSSTSSTSISCSITGLEFSKKYYYRAYAINSVGVSYGEQKSFITTDATYSAGLTGLFSISSTQQVIFSGGNLRYKASTNEWQFAKHQYDIVGADNANISPYYDGWIDLFGWGTGNNPTLTSTSSSDYATFVDWGNNTINGVSGQWRTLALNEWNYLINRRDKNLSTFAIVNGVKGWVLLPDDWVMPSGISMEFYWYGSGWNNVYFKTTPNKYTAAQWTILENAGAVFFPVTGMRYESYGTIIVDYIEDEISDRGYYWASDRLRFKEGSTTVAGGWANAVMSDSYFSSYNYNGTAFAVRLVQVK